LLAPLALMAYALGFWRLFADLGIAGEFALGGVYSHWQVWIATAAALHVAALVFNRYGRGEELRIPGALTPKLGPLPAQRTRFDKTRPEVQ
jgi:hypothetical protein